MPTSPFSYAQGQIHSKPPIFASQRSSNRWTVPAFMDPYACERMLTSQIAGTMISGGWTKTGVGYDSIAWASLGGAPPPTDAVRATQNLPPTGPGSFDYLLHTAGTLLTNRSGRLVWLRTVQQRFFFGGLYWVPVFRMFGAGNTYYDSDSFSSSGPGGDANWPGGDLYMSANPLSVTFATQNGINSGTYMGSPVHTQAIYDTSLVYFHQWPPGPWVGDATFMNAVFVDDGPINPCGGGLYGGNVVGWVGPRWQGWAAKDLRTPDGEPLAYAPEIKIYEGTTKRSGTRGYGYDLIAMTCKGAFGEQRRYFDWNCICVSTCPGVADSSPADQWSLWMVMS